MSPQIVMKFGGTSLGSANAIKKAAELISAQLDRRPLIVVSAVGGVTDLLEKGAIAAKSGQDWLQYVQKITDLHREICRELEIDQRDVNSLERELTRWLQGVYLLRELTPRVRDALLSLGERISVRILAEVLRKKGLRAKAWKSWELGLITNGRHNKAEVLNECYNSIQEHF